MALRLRPPGPVGVRLDSGDLAGLAVRARRLLDDAGLPEARIVASGGLDEHAIAALVAADAPIDAYGVGTKMGVSADAPYLDSAYKLVAYDGRPVMKLSRARRPGRAPNRSTAARPVTSSGCGTSPDRPDTSRCSSRSCAEAAASAGPSRWPRRENAVRRAWPISRPPRGSCGKQNPYRSPSARYWPRSPSARP